MRRIALLACVAALAGCGSESAKPELTVSAAASLKTAMTTYAESFEAAAVRSSFAGSDELAAQIRQGVRPDVFASANTKLPDQLFAKGLVEQPKVFTGNRLVLAVPAGSGKMKVGSLEDLDAPGITLAIGAEDVPVGAYTRTVLDRLPPSERRGILARVRSNEPDVGGVVGKLVQGAVDAGFVYVTDVKATGGKLRAIELPERLRPTVAYGVAVVKGTKHPAEAAAFVTGLIRGAGQAELRSAGFEPAPRPGTG